MSESLPTGQRPRPRWAWRRWKAAAGPLAGLHIPAAPFTSLELFGLPRVPLRERLSPVALDAVSAGVADRLAATEQVAAVRQGEVALVLDLPGALAVGVGCHLQAAGVAPVLLFGGLYRPGSLLEGRDTLPALLDYSRRLQSWRDQQGYVFLLERDRTGPTQLDDLRLWQTFENRYHTGEHTFPPLADLKEAGLQAFIDLRAEGDELPDDINYFYRSAARAGFDIFQATLPAQWFTGSTSG